MSGISLHSSGLFQTRMPNTAMHPDAAPRPHSGAGDHPSSFGGFGDAREANCPIVASYLSTLPEQKFASFVSIPMDLISVAWPWSKVENPPLV